MARKLKTYQTSLGFFDQAIAAPSMKAALEAWGARQQSLPPGRRPGKRRSRRDRRNHGKAGHRPKAAGRHGRPFGEDAGRPTGLSRIGLPKLGRAPKSRRPKSIPAPVDKAAERKAALAYEREQKRRDASRPRRRRSGGRSASGVSRPSTTLKRLWTRQNASTQAMSRLCTTSSTRLRKNCVPRTSDGKKRARG